MKIGTVVSSVWATKKCPTLVGQTLLCVEIDKTLVVAADLVGAGEGDRVMLAFGSGARLGSEVVPVDAAIVAILDESELSYVHQ